MPHYGRSTQILGLLGWIALAAATAAIGGIASREAPTFYGRLDQPSWAPPPGVFGPVWTLLFLLMAIAAWLVWRRHRSPGARIGLALFAVQLGVNALWSWLFFAWHRGGLALADAVLLALLIAATMASFWRVSRLAALLLLPYLGWVAFACVLTWSLWRRNPGLL